MVLAETLDVSTAVGGLVVAIALASLAAVGLLWKSTGPGRIEPGPATTEFRDEPPAIVDLLVGGFEAEDDAVPATVVDLAARGLFTIESFGERVVLRLRSAAGTDDLTAYEQRVLRHVQRHAVDGVAPAETLTIGPEGVSHRWFTGFVREVNKHAQQLGLCRRRFDLKHLAIAWGLVVVGFGPTWLVAGFARRTTSPTGWGSAGNLLTGLGFVCGLVLVWAAQRLSRSNAQTPTEPGRIAAAHWLGVRAHFRSVGDFSDKPAASVAIWDRHLAYATAMGLAPEVQRQLPFETEHDRHAWSLATGSWRRVKVRYQAFVPGWGQHPGRIAFESLIQGAFSAALAVGGFYIANAEFDTDIVTDRQRQWIGLVGLVVAVAAGAVAVFSAAKVLLGLSDLFTRTTLEGEVVRRREFRTGHRLPKVVQWAMWSGRDEHGMRRDHDRRTRLHVAIDTGDDDSILAHVVRPEIFGRAPQGARVRITTTRRLGYVRSLDVIATPRASAASERHVPHELAEDAARTAGGRLMGSMATAFERMEAMTDGQGRPVLDQVDDDGVTLKDKMAESSAQIEAMRNDPRLRNTLAGGLLDAFLSGPADDESADDEPGS